METGKQKDERGEAEEANHAMNRPQDIRKRQTQGVREAATEPATGAAINRAWAGAEMARGDASEGGETEDALARAAKNRR